VLDFVYFQVKLANEFIISEIFAYLLSVLQFCLNIHLSAAVVAKCHGPGFSYICQA